MCANCEGSYLYSFDTNFIKLFYHLKLLLYKVSCQSDYVSNYVIIMIQIEKLESWIENKGNIPMEGESK